MFRTFPNFSKVQKWQICGASPRRKLPLTVARNGSRPGRAEQSTAPRSGAQQQAPREERPLRQEAERGAGLSYRGVGNGALRNGILGK